MKPIFRIAILALTMIIVAMLSALTAMRFAIHGQEVQVPSIIGLAPIDAQRAVSGLGLQIEVERQYYSPQIPEGRIMSQVPLPGTKVRRGWQLRVAESMGPQRVSIPKVTGDSERVAEFNLRRRGLELSSTAEIQMPGTAADQVIAQNPPANANQVSAPQTSILISAAVDPTAFVMPSFIGQPLGTATRTLQDSGFKLGSVSIAPPPIAALPPVSAGSPAAPAPPNLPASSQPSPASIIVSQTPPAGQKVLLGAVVNFEVR